MSNLKDFSDQDIQEEMKRRKKESRTAPPQNDNPRFDGLIVLCHSYVEGLSQNGFADEGLSNYIFEAAMQAVYNKDIFSWINQVRV